MLDVLGSAPWWMVAATALGVVACVVWGLRVVLARGSAPARPRLHGGYLVATALISIAALGLITVAFTMSYAALYAAATWLEDTQLTAINGGDLRFLFPIGIDAVIVYFLAMDLLMEWQGRRHPLNRWAAYGLSAITVILNVAQGDGGTASYLGHAGPPVVIILIAEGVAAWVRHLAGLAHGQTADRIPLGRWIAHPLSTLKVARLMLGWGVTSYPDALAREQRRQLAYAMLRQQYGRAWRKSTPRHLKWMLDNGYQLDTAYELTRALTQGNVAMTAIEITGHLDRGGESDQNGHVESAGARTTDGRTAIPVVIDAGSNGHDGRRTLGSVVEHADLNGGPDLEASAADDTAETASSPVSSTGFTPSQVVEPSPEPEERDVQQPPRKVNRSGSRLTPVERTQRVRQLLDTVPDITDEEIAAQIGVVPRTARHYRAKVLAGNPR